MSLDVSSHARPHVLDGSGAFDLVDLCRIHDAERHVLGIAEVLGDGVLLRRIPALEAMRCALLHAGYRFAPLDALSPTYDTLPLLKLADILDTRTIPYRRNLRAMREIARAAPTMRFDELTFRDTAPQCLTSHESAHALFFEAARERDGALLDPGGRVPGSAEARRFVEVLIASEGFALGFDVFVVLLGLADGRASTLHLLSINSAADQYGFAGYERKNPGVLGQLARLATERPAAVLRLLSASCVIANLRPRATSTVGPGLLRWLADVACFPIGFDDEARCIASIGLRIDHAFRMRTAPTLFRFLGIEDEFHAVLGEPLERAFADEAPFLACLEPVIACVTGAPHH